MMTYVLKHFKRSKELNFLEKFFTTLCVVQFLINNIQSDNLNIFDSKHERDISLKLSNIGNGLKELMFSIEEMGRNIEYQLSDLSYVTEQSSQSLISQLQQVDSSLKTNNLLTTINTYQTYKLRI